MSEQRHLGLGPAAAGELDGHRAAPVAIVYALGPVSGPHLNPVVDAGRAGTIPAEHVHAAVVDALVPEGG